MGIQGVHWIPDSGHILRAHDFDLLSHRWNLAESQDQEGLNKRLWSFVAQLQSLRLWMGLRAQSIGTPVSGASSLLIMFLAAWLCRAVCTCRAGNFPRT